ncbi:hypothetical protein O181_003192 [Austropuccinia psidii MF-1]|uniref:Uncharacterized protein n=1 Tax=Austropuccinia psidii MF-1 TaxID=1389203 RepID=A0A9Q3BDX0_9BASI|nr:hypothetical protein [Austropuccinia psidii MF-1]
MEPIQSNHNSKPTMKLTTTPDVSNVLASLIQLQQSLSSLIRNLKDDIDRMKVSSVSQKSKVKFNTKQKISPKKSTKRKNSQPSISEPPPSTSSPLLGNSIAAPISSTKTTTKSPVKGNPLQMQTADFPAYFKGVKEALSVHIKVLWGVVEQNTIPTEPAEETLAQSYRKFSSEGDIEKILKDLSAPSLIYEKEILTLACEKLEKHKLG